MSAPRGEPKAPKAGLEPTKVKLVALEAGTYYRCAAKIRPSLDWDNREISRFSHPTFPCAVLYLAPTKETGFWECYGDELNDQLLDERQLYKDQLQARQWVKFEVPKMEVFDSTHISSLRSAKTDISSFVGSYPITQAWSKFLMGTPAQGILYRSRLDSDQKCLALFGRPSFLKKGAIKAEADGDLSVDPTFLHWIAAQNIDLI
jgi:hypothetical protein